MMTGPGLSDKSTFEILIEGKRETIEIHRSENRTQVFFRGQLTEVDVVEISANSFSLIISGRSYHAVVAGVDGTFQVLIDGVPFEIPLLDPKKLRHFTSGLVDTTGPVPVVAAMPGKVVKLLVTQGDLVKEGQGVAVIEAMKMQNELKAPKSGKVEKVNISENQTVNAGESLMVLQ
jgi:biotin carboxyl carrier protein